MSFDNPTMLYKVDKSAPNLEYEKELYQTRVVDALEAETLVGSGEWYQHPYGALAAYQATQNPMPVVPEELLTSEETPVDGGTATATRSRK